MLFSPVPSTLPLDNAHRESHTGIIVGATVGGFLFTVALGAAVFFLKSRHSQNRRGPCHITSIIRKSRSDLIVVDPFPPPLPAIGTFLTVR